MRICAASQFKHEIASLSPDSLRKAISFFERAVQLDPNFAPAWAQLSRAHVYFYYGRTTQPPLDAMRPKELWSMRRNSSQTRLKPCSPWVITNIGCCAITGLPKRRSRHVSKMLPDSSDVPRALALITRPEGNWNESVAYVERALALDPTTRSY